MSTCASSQSQDVISDTSSVDCLPGLCKDPESREVGVLQALQCLSLHLASYTQRKQMGPVDVNGGVHTARKQHQRICVRICARASSVDWALSTLCGIPTPTPVNRCSRKRQFVPRFRFGAAQVRARYGAPTPTSTTYPVSSKQYSVTMFFVVCRNKTFAVLMQFVLFLSRAHVCDMYGRIPCAPAPPFIISSNFLILVFLSCVPGRCAMCADPFCAHPPPKKHEKLCCYCS